MSEYGVEELKAFFYTYFPQRASRQMAELHHSSGKGFQVCHCAGTPISAGIYTLLRSLLKRDCLFGFHEVIDKHLYGILQAMDYIRFVICGRS